MDRKAYIDKMAAQLKKWDAEIEKLEAKGFRPEILKSNGRYRVAMLKYTDRNRALRELDRLRKEKPNESVWLLGL